MKHTFAVAIICAFAALTSAKVSWHKELSTARELALGRMLGQAPSPDPSPSAAPTVSPSPSHSPSHSPSSSGSPSASPSPSHSAHSATKSVTATPTASLTHGATPSASPLPAVVIKIVQSVSVFTLDQLEGHPEVVQALLQAFKKFVANSTASVEQVRVIALIDGLTRLSTPVPANHQFNQGADDRRRLFVVPEGGAGIQYSLSVPAVAVTGDPNGAMTQAAQIEAATQARVQMLLQDDQGGFREIMVPIIEEQAALLGVDTTNLVTLLGWEDSTMEIPENPRATTSTSKKYPTGAILGVIFGVMGGALLVGCLMWAAGLCKRRKREEEQVQTWGARAQVADPNDITLTEGGHPPTTLTYITAGATPLTAQVVTLQPGEPVSVLSSRV